MYTYTYAYTCIHVHMYTCARVYMYTCIHVYMYTCIYVRIHIRMRMHIRIRIRIRMPIRIRLRIRVRMHMHMRMRMAWLGALITIYKEENLKAELRETEANLRKRFPRRLISSASKVEQSSSGKGQGRKAPCHKAHPIRSPAPELPTERPLDTLKAPKWSH